MRVDTKGFTVAKLDAYQKEFHKEVYQAQMNSMNRVATTIRAETAREIASASGLKPVKRIKERMARFRATKKVLVCGVYFRYASMPAEMLAPKSGVKWTRKMKGARAGNKLYEGTFGATPHAGKYADKRMRIYTRVSRTGSNRKDLVVKYIPLKQYEPILAKVGNTVVERDLESTFIQQFEFRMDQIKGA
jgi:hypothetical protein